MFQGIDVANDPFDSEEDLKSLQQQTITSKNKLLEKPYQNSNSIPLPVSGEAIYKVGQEVDALKARLEKLDSKVDYNGNMVCKLKFLNEKTSCCRCETNLNN